jgi:hypothetical protein
MQAATGVDVTDDNGETSQWRHHSSSVIGLLTNNMAPTPSVKNLRVRSNIICSGNFLRENAVHNSVVGKVFGLETEECRFNTRLGFFFFSREFL